MKQTNLLLCKLFIGALFLLGSVLVNGEDPYMFYTWTVTYGTRSPLGVPQQVILINNQFPGPPIEAVTNNNVVVNLINKLDEPFLITWNGVKQRRTSWQDGLTSFNLKIKSAKAAYKIFPLKFS
ncbi:PREDICTED: L-ascorbate oxidase homolog [Camelina sativa]|uniref:L-ascorbate oxidase homolog n=1 Tax=Camelina sativa TaxID=90675 RepID=A0ABM0URC4_CAMSA|nr:PREDICTED: L-ascorbate oxidase homolog [Camelina sativa]